MKLGESDASFPTRGYHLQLKLNLAMILHSWRHQSCAVGCEPVRNAGPRGLE